MAIISGPDNKHRDGTVCCVIYGYDARFVRAEAVPYDVGFAGKFPVKDGYNVH